MPESPATSWSWTLREILIVAVLGAAFGVLYLAWVQVWLIAQAIFGPVTMDVVMGFWFIVSIIAAKIIRKPGAALLSELLTAVAALKPGTAAPFNVKRADALVELNITPGLRPRPQRNVRR